MNFCCGDGSINLEKNFLSCFFNFLFYYFLFFCFALIFLCHLLNYFLPSFYSSCSDCFLYIIGFFTFFAFVFDRYSFRCFCFSFPVFWSFLRTSSQVSCSAS